MRRISPYQIDVDTEKVSEIVKNSLHEVLAHMKSANTAEIMMTYAVMIKSTLIGLGLPENKRDIAKQLFDEIYMQVLVSQ